MSGNFQFDTRPEVDVIVYRHRADCRFPLKEKDGRCRCPKHLYVRLTRARISAKTKSWETARQRAKEWADNHDPVILRERAREADNAACLGCEWCSRTDSFSWWVATKWSRPTWALVLG